MGDADERCEKLIAELRERGHRDTSQRAAVIRHVTASREHPSVEEICGSVAADFPMTSLATVYNTISTLKDMGEVSEISLAGGSARYDASRPYSHPHLICTECRKTVDLEIEALEDTVREVVGRTGY